MKNILVHVLVLWICFLQPFFIQADEKRPLIGITSTFESEPDGRRARITTRITYVNAVLEAGGTPVVLPTIQDTDAMNHYLDLLDGLVLVGGRDIPPEVYGEEPHPTVVPLPATRYNFEKQLIDSWLSRNQKPVLGICLGLQFTNVVRGGSLIQDIPAMVGTAVSHSHKNGATHPVTLQPNSRLQQILGAETIEVNSFHHQAVKKIGEGLVVAGKSPDGVIEAIELDSDRFGIFVQWHPERIADAAHRQKIFNAFIRACQKTMSESLTASVNS